MTTSGVISLVTAAVTVLYLLVTLVGWATIGTAARKAAGDLRPAQPRCTATTTRDDPTAHRHRRPGAGPPGDGA